MHPVGSYCRDVSQFTVNRTLNLIRSDNYSPSSDPHTRGIISRIAEHDVSSKHNWRASRHLRIATAVLTLGPKNRKIRNTESIKITKVGIKNT